MIELYILQSIVFKEEYTKYRNNQSLYTWLSWNTLKHWQRFFPIFVSFFLFVYVYKPWRMIFIIRRVMELLQVLHKNIPQKKKVFARFQRKWDHDLSKFLLQMIRNIKKESKDVKILNAFFIELYDMIYQYIIFDKVKIAKKIVRLLEELALPIKYVGEQKWTESLKKIRKMKL